ncbi:glycosyltransferase [Nocardia sp. CC227C]|uniref:glycosyltransferase n=1 Tax=Nocardia sp. CC227C TaxID=3044562 RepID=UPI00278BF790|nr:glycosyltransferase [Nocardia sp. CC227C]
MRMLFVAGGSPSTVFPLVPLATAVRNVGHEVVVAVTDYAVESVTHAGLSATSVSSTHMFEYMFKDRTGRPISELPDPEQATDPHVSLISHGHGMGRLAAGCLDRLVSFCEDWRPDVIIGSTLSFAAQIAASRFGIPYVKHAVCPGEPPDVDRGAEAELAPELERFGLDRLPAGDLVIDICPPSVRPLANPAPAQSMRYVPGNTQRGLEPWMYTRPDRPRVVVTSGSRVAKGFQLEDLIAQAKKITPLDMEVVVAVSDHVAEEVRQAVPGVWAGWVPLDVVLRTSDLVVHGGGGNTMLTAIVAGIPQLGIPVQPKQASMQERLVARGAGMELTLADATPDTVAKACRGLVETPSYREQAQELSVENAAQPSPAEVVGVVEALVDGWDK